MRSFISHRRVASVLHPNHYHIYPPTTMDSSEDFASQRLTLLDVDPNDPFPPLDAKKGAMVRSSQSQSQSRARMERYEEEPSQYAIPRVKGSRGVTKAGMVRGPFQPRNDLRSVIRSVRFCAMLVVTGSHPTHPAFFTCRNLKHGRCSRGSVCRRASTRRVRNGASRGRCRRAGTGCRTCGA